MSTRRTRLLAWGLALLTLLVTLGAALIPLSGKTPVDAGSSSFIWAITLTFCVTGLLIALRQPANAIGWLFLLIGFSAALGSLAGSHARNWVDHGAGPDLLGQTAASYGALSWMPFILLPATFGLLLFPDGHLLSDRWRPIARSAGWGIAGGFVATALSPGPIEDYPSVQNPYAVDSVVVDLLAGVSALAIVVGLLGSAVSIVLRFRRARGEQRLQMKLIAAAGAVAAVTIPLMILAYDDVGADVANALMMLSIMGLPVATAVAIRRYRLYDIDLVINRALVYGALTATLAGFYVGSVLLLQLALSGVTEESGMAVAASTLAVAALFRPVRARIQDAVDRRFFRSRYDAARTIDAFNSRLRDEVDLHTLSTSLQSVVQETMHPTHVSVWFRLEETP